MGLKNKWKVILQKEMGRVEIDSFRTKEEALDYLHNRKELTRHLTGDEDVYTLEYVK